MLSDGRRAPDRNEFCTRAKELRFSNDDAFANLTRKPAGSKVPLRLAHFRKFWEGLDNMAYYWDNSLDEYLPPKLDSTSVNMETATDASTASSGTSTGNAVGPELQSGKDDASPLRTPGIEEPRKKPKTEPACNEVVSPPMDFGFGNFPNTKPPSISSSKALPARTAPPKLPWAANIQGAQDKPEDLSRGSYRGYRIGNGAEMPDQYRLDTVRAFLEPIAWAFGVTFVPHRRPPVLCLGNVRFPVRMNSVAWRAPVDRVKARQGWMEGPVLGLQCRPETNFGATGNLEAESVLDVVRELGGMLLLAQERAREGKTERKAGQGKWWTSKPRWGGGPGGEVGDGAGSTDAPLPKPVQRAEERLTRMIVSSKERKPKPSPAEIWKVLRPGNALWDPKVVYEAIGKDKDAEWDEVRMTTHFYFLFFLAYQPLLTR